MLCVSEPVVETSVIDSSKFLEPKPGNFAEVNQFNSFTVEKKRLFLELYRKNPDITKCSEIIGVCRQTVWHARNNDEAFKAAFDGTREGLCDQLEARVYEYAQRPQNFMDRIAYLRAFRPSVWNQQANVNVTHSVEVVHSLADKAKAYQNNARTPKELGEGTSTT